MIHCEPGLTSDQIISTLSDHLWGKIIVLVCNLTDRGILADTLIEYGQKHGPVILVPRLMEVDLLERRLRGYAGQPQDEDIQWSECETQLRSMATYIFPLIEASISGPDSYTKQIVRHGELSDERILSVRDSALASPNVKQDLLRLLRFIRGTNTNHVPNNSNQSYYLSLTFDHVELAQPVIEELSIGVDCWEIRSDLLADHTIPSIIHQIGLLRRYSDLPIIFSMRTKIQAGSIPDSEEDSTVISQILEAASVALKLGVEYLDIDNTLPVHLWKVLIRNKGNTKIIASYQDFEGRLSWQKDEALLQQYYIEGCDLGADVVRIVNLAKNVQDNLEARRFAAEVQGRIPLIVINVGSLVSLPDLPWRLAQSIN